MSGFRLIAGLLTAALLAAGCQFTIIRGSGELVEQTRELADFDRLAASNAFVVDVAVGDEPAVTVTADDNVIEHVTMSISDGQLRLRLQPGFQVRGATLEAAVTAPQLAEVQASGASTVRVHDPLGGARFRARASGASDVVAPLDVGAVEVVASGASTVRLGGTAGEADLRGSGASDLELADLAVDAAQVRLSGASEGALTVADALDVELSGASSFVYHGDPPTITQQLSGASSLESG